MDISYQTLQKMARDLPPFEGNQKAISNWLQSTDVQAYLNHYHINFCNEVAKLSHRFGQLHAGGFSIACHQWQPQQARGTVILVHGYTDNVGSMQHIIRFLLEQQWAVVAFDLPGHGLSSGEQASIDSFDQYRQVLFDVLNQLQDKTPNPWHILGQSTGAAVILNYLASYPDQQKIDRALLLAPLVRSYGWQRDRCLFALIKPFVSSLKRTFTLSSHDQNFLDFVQHRDPLQPLRTPVAWIAAMREWVGKFTEMTPQWRQLMVIQGDDDHTVDWEFNIAEIERVFPKTDTHIISGAHHQLVNEAPAYRNQVFSLVGQWLRSEK